MSCATCGIQVTESAAIAASAPAATGAMPGGAGGVPEVIASFWRGLRSTGKTGRCPVCGAQDLEVRSTRHRGRTWKYVLHCGSVQMAEWPDDGKHRWVG
jgi:hypothetical protein